MWREQLNVGALPQNMATEEWGGRGGSALSGENNSRAFRGLRSTSTNGHIR